MEEWIYEYISNFNVLLNITVGLILMFSIKIIKELWEKKKQ
tara:strand:+ start:4087 stop:4209 length:123 start_codon:yes stop_codon:yes gene_type:complete